MGPRRRESSCPRSQGGGRGRSGGPPAGGGGGGGVGGGPGRPGGPLRGSERGGGGGSQAAPSPCQPGQSRSPAAQTAREDAAARSRAPSRDARSEPAARLERPGPSRGRGRGTQARKEAAGGATLPSNGDPRKALGGSSRRPSSWQGPPQPECRGCRTATALSILAGCAHLLPRRKCSCPCSLTTPDSARGARGLPALRRSFGCTLVTILKNSDSSLIF